MVRDMLAAEVAERHAAGFAPHSVRRPAARPVRGSQSVAARMQVAAA
jgi:hypothetical protein